ncbi:hypothetical protein [Nocardiopsis ansamitocini]|uniref:Uncharacterized protein n=1 Tax=Nocardiopsis ansamitocini TaxID=1670832 RepID=A0A9W6UJI0_9ACTN|nr:hypothetical protein [Nocardiopsis ansamitocini]GLU48080.1 hypothetical protein Nans01_24310 [Nocardiopsis ansamitocini]
MAKFAVSRRNPRIEQVCRDMQRALAADGPELVPAEAGGAVRTLAGARFGCTGSFEHAGLIGAADRHGGVLVPLIAHRPDRGRSVPARDARTGEQRQPGTAGRYPKGRMTWLRGLLSRGALRRILGLPIGCAKGVGMWTTKNACPQNACALRTPTATSWPSVSR